MGLAPYGNAKEKIPKINKTYIDIFKEIISYGTKLIKVGSKLKVIINAVISPKVIISPKSIIGFISLNINERNAIIVVRTVYKIGQNILLVVKVISSKMFLLG